LLAKNNFKENLINLVQGGRDNINKFINTARNFNQRLSGLQSRRGANTNKIDMKIETFRKYRNYSKHLLGRMELIGKGFKDPNKLCERLNLLVAAK